MKDAGNVFMSVLWPQSFTLLVTGVDWGRSALGSSFSGTRHSHISPHICDIWYLPMTKELTLHLSLLPYAWCEHVNMKLNNIKQRLNMQFMGHLVWTKTEICTVDSTIICTVLHRGWVAAAPKCFHSHVGESNKVKFISSGFNCMVTVLMDTWPAPYFMSKRYLADLIWFNFVLKLNQVQEYGQNFMCSPHQELENPHDYTDQTFQSDLFFPPASSAKEVQKQCQSDHPCFCFWALHC